RNQIAMASNFQSPVAFWASVTNFCGVKARPEENLRRLPRREIIIFTFEPPTSMTSIFFKRVNLAPQRPRSEPICQLVSFSRSSASSHALEIVRENAIAPVPVVQDLRV